jgi:hypothetical protein
MMEKGFSMEFFYVLSLPAVYVLPAPVNPGLRLGYHPQNMELVHSQAVALSRPVHNIYIGFLSKQKP